MKILVLFIVVIFVVCSVQGASIDNAINSTIAQDQGSTYSQVIGKHRELVKQFQAQNSNLLTDDYLRCDNFSIGLLSRNKWNVLSASKSLKRLLLWRFSNNVENLGKAKVDPILHKFFPYHMTSADDGCPVLVADFGNWQLADFIESQEFVRDAVKSFDKYTIQLLEKFRLAIKNLSPKCEQAFVVINTKGLTPHNYADANAANALVHVATIAEIYYPNLFKKIVIVNSNADLVALVQIVVRYIEQTSKQLVMFKEEETEQAKEFISQYVDPESLNIFSTLKL